MNDAPHNARGLRSEQLGVVPQEGSIIGRSVNERHWFLEIRGTLRDRLLISTTFICKRHGDRRSTAHDGIVKSTAIRRAAFAHSHTVVSLVFPDRNVRYNTPFFFSNGRSHI